MSPAKSTASYKKRRRVEQQARLNRLERRLPELVEAVRAAHREVETAEKRRLLDGRNSRTENRVLVAREVRRQARKELADAEASAGPVGNPTAATAKKRGGPDGQ